MKTKNIRQRTTSASRGTGNSCRSFFHSPPLMLVVMNKIKKITAIILGMSLAVVSIVFAAEPQVTIEQKWPHLNTDAKECGGFSEDNLILRIKINKKEITDEFCSSYGISDAKIIKDSRGINFLILKTAQGRGTHSTTQYLTVYRIENHLEELARFPVYEPAGIATNCYFDYKINKPKDGGLLFLITVRIEDKTSEDAEWIPKEKNRTILIK